MDRLVSKEVVGNWEGIKRDGNDPAARLVVERGRLKESQFKKGETMAWSAYLTHSGPVAMEQPFGPFVQSGSSE